MEGYLYCFSNKSMPDILKVGMTERTPEIRLSEANSSDTWRPPTQYKIELAKKVFKPKEKEITLHKLLSLYSDRINPKREFFKIPLKEVKIFFELMDGELWENLQGEDKEEEIEEEEIEEEGEEEGEADNDKSIIPHECVDGERIDLYLTANEFLDEFYPGNPVQKSRWKQRLQKKPSEMKGSDLTMYNLLVFASRRKKGRVIEEGRIEEWIDQMCEITDNIPIYIGDIGEGVSGYMVAPTHFDGLFYEFKEWCLEQGYKSPDKKKTKQYLLKWQEKCKYGLEIGRYRKDAKQNGTLIAPSFNLKVVEEE